MIEYQEKEHTMQNMPIAIFRGDDTDALGYQTIVGTIKTDLNLTGCKAAFRYLSFSAEFDPIPEDKKLTVIIPASETKKFPPGLGYASLRVYDAEGKLCTFSNRIMVFVATKTPMFGNEEFEVDFNVRPELEPLKIFVGPNPDDFDEYRGFLEKVIDRASAEKYGLAMLLDAIDSDLGADDGVAATPVAVKAAYAAVIKKLTDDYYTKEETDEAIDRVAAYYITYDAAGNPFPTYAALANATTVYSGGAVRVPTRNDYAVVLADETHDGAEYRYIYAVPAGQTVGQWEPQYPIETNDYAALSNKPQINGNTLTGNKTGVNLGLVDASGGRANQLRLLIAATNGSSAGLYSLRVKYDGSTFNDKATLEIVKQPAGSGNEVIVATIDLPASDGTLAFLQNIAPNFSTSATYALDALCVYGGALYRCTTAVTMAGAWTGSTNWTAATVNDVLAALRAAIPFPSTSTPNPDGTGSPGSASFGFSCGNHRHPSDSKKLDKSGGTMTGGLTFYDSRLILMPDPLVPSMTVMGAGIVFPTTSGILALTAGTGHTGNLAALDSQGNPTDAGWTAGDLARYSLTTKTIDNGAVTLDDRAINAVAVSSSLASLTINFPTATSGKARDFGLRLTVASGITTAPQIVLPQGVTCENADGEAPEIGADGAATILYFTETASGVFLVKGEVLQTIA